MSRSKIAYIISRFPVLTETFIIREIEEVKRKDTEVVIFSLRNVKKNETIHSGLEELVNDTYYLPYFFSLNIFGPILFYLGNQFINTLQTLTYIIRTHFKNPITLLKILVIFPKTLAIAFILRKQEITNIHAHWATIPTTVAWIISNLNGSKYTFTAHAWDIFKTDTMLEEKISGAKKVVTCTKYNKEYLLEKFPRIDPAKIIVIYHGLDLKKFSRAGKKNDPQFKILCIGRLSEEKGIHYLLEACAILRENDVPFRAQLIYVRGNYENEIFRLYDRLGLRQEVELIPGMPQDELMKYYNNADCFVLSCIISKTGERDGIPNVILEALAMELPVVSTSVSGIPEVIRDNVTGLLVEPGDSMALAEAIEKLYRDRELGIELGRNGRLLVSREFDLSTNVSRLLETILKG